MKGLPDIEALNVSMDKIKSNWPGGTAVTMLRLDKIHKHISGNKFFKLYYYLQGAIAGDLPVITFGGAFSNHLYATAAACRMAGISCTGIVRGEKTATLSPTLQFCIDNGMKLVFISRKQYGLKNNNDFIQDLVKDYGEHLLIPEGGFGPEGVAGASLISNFYGSNFTHICCACGTATTLAGLITQAKPFQQIIGFSVLNQPDDLEVRLDLLIGKAPKTIIRNFNFGGFAKHSPELISFMNYFYEEFHIPTDFVYTAKMMYGIIDMINKEHFPPGSEILCIHTGGLQGNNSLPTGLLNF